MFYQFLLASSKTVKLHMPFFKESQDSSLPSQILLDKPDMATHLGSQPLEASQVPGPFGV